jgi:hypothetical protein
MRRRIVWRERRVQPLLLDAVEIREGPRVLATDADVDAIQRTLGTRMPDGYRAYVTRLGEGALNDMVRVLPPWSVLDQLAEHQGLMAAYWRWEPGRTSFDQEYAMDSIPVADTVVGDMVAIHPDDPGKIIVLPRDGDRLYARGPDLLEVVNWMLSGRVIGSAGPRRYFVPYDSRTDPDWPVRRPRPATAPEVHDVPPAPATPLETLLAYFAKLRDIEAWAIEAAGGPQAFMRARPPRIAMETHDEISRRTELARTRYCTPRLAEGLRGSSIPMTSVPLFDASMIRIVEEVPASRGRVVIRTSERIQPTLPDWIQRREYVMEPEHGRWRIAATRDLELEAPPPAPNP